MRERRLWAPALAVLLAVVMLGPALAPGYVLSYDMVWVPHLSLRPDFLGLGSGLPRAVPSDAVVAVVNAVIPGMLLQKLVLLGTLVAGGLGASRLPVTGGAPAALGALAAYEWSPLVAERLVIGHWPLLITWAVLPWLVVTARGRSGAVPRCWWWLLPVASLSAGGGVLAGVLALGLGLSGAVRRRLALFLLVVAANLPWLVSGLLHADSARSDPLGAEVFALHGTGGVPAPLVALGLGGIWNLDSVPATQQSALVLLQVCGVVVLAGLGLARRAGTRELRVLGILWLVGYGWAVGTWLVPEVSAWLGDHVAGGALFRDGSRSLLWCAPLLAMLVGQGIAAACSWVVARGPRVILTVALVALPLAVMPDAAFGVSGRLRAVTYPSSYDDVRSVVANHGDVLVLPFSSYRAPAWNGGRAVLDPLGRYLRPDYVASDALVVGKRTLRGEDPVAARCARALALSDPAARAKALEQQGIAVVVTERDAGPSPAIAAPARDVGELRVQFLTDVRRRGVATGWVVAMSFAWGGFLGLPITGWLRSRRRASSSSFLTKAG